jgi:transposase
VQIRHDRDPAFLSEVFKAFNEMLGQRQLPTLAYRPQANGATERMIQTLIRAVKKYSKVKDHTDWDIIAERLALAINTSFDTIRQETPFFLVHGGMRKPLSMPRSLYLAMKKPRKHGDGA